LPKTLTQRFEVRILADSAFGSTQMLQWVKQRKRTAAIFGVSCDRRLADGRHVGDLPHQGQQVYLWGVDFPVTVSWYWLVKDDGSREKRFVVSTQPKTGVYITLLL
jgi:hypothetical protein